MSFQIEQQMDALHKQKASQFKKTMDVKNTSCQRNALKIIIEVAIQSDLMLCRMAVFQSESVKFQL